MSWANPWMFLFLLTVPLMIWYFIKKKAQKNTFILYSDTKIIQENYKLKFMPEKIIFFIRITAILLLIFACAGPRKGLVTEEILTKGIDIMICLDTSTSMAALDFKPDNRLNVAKEVVEKFIKGRKNDRIGIVVFGGVSFLQAPLTLDSSALLEFLQNVQIGITESDGTAIGSAIGTAVNHLKESDGKSKIIILVTDGRNNAGKIDPVTSARLAQAEEIKIYTVGVGTEGEVPFQIKDPVFGVPRIVYLKESLDDKLLTKIANITDALYFRATDPEALYNIFDKINQLEKIDIKIKKHTQYKEKYPYFLWPGLILFFIEVLLANTIWRKIP